MDDAEAQYLAFFASKTIGMIRAPDSFVYPAPFNLFEVFFVSPFEFVATLLSFRTQLIWMQVVPMLPPQLAEVHDAQPLRDGGRVLHPAGDNCIL